MKKITFEKVNDGFKIINESGLNIKMNEVTLNNINRIMQIVQKHKLSFYIEHNDYLKGDISIYEEVEDLLKEEEIDSIDAGECLRLDSVWSARFYFNNGENYKIAYASTFEKVVQKILEIMENHDENDF